MSSANEQVIEVLNKQLQELQRQRETLQKEFTSLKATIVKGERLGVIGERKKFKAEEEQLKEQYAEKISAERKRLDREQAALKKKHYEQGIGREDAQESLAKLESKYRRRRAKLSREFAGGREEVAGRYSPAAAEARVEEKLSAPRKEYEAKVADLESKIAELEKRLTEGSRKPAKEKKTSRALPNAFAPEPGTWPDRPPTAKGPGPRRKKLEPEQEVPPVPPKPEQPGRKGYLPHQTRIQEGLRHRNIEPSGHIPTEAKPPLELPEEGPDTRIQKPTRKIARDKRDADRAAARAEAKMKREQEKDLAKHQSLVESLRKIHAAAMEREAGKTFGTRMLNRVGLGDVQVEGLRGIGAGLRGLRGGFNLESMNTLATGAGRLLKGAPVLGRGIGTLAGAGGGAGGGGGMGAVLGGGAAGAGGALAGAAGVGALIVGTWVAVGLVMKGLNDLAHALSEGAAKVLEYNRKYTDASALMSTVFTRLDIARFQMRREMGDRLTPAAQRLADQQIRTERALMSPNQFTETLGMQLEYIKSNIAERLGNALSTFTDIGNRVNEWLGWNNPQGVHGIDMGNWIVEIANHRLGFATPRPAMTPEDDRQGRRAVRFAAAGGNFPGYFAVEAIRRFFGWD